VKTKPDNSQFKQIFDQVADQYEQVSNPYTIGRRTQILSDWARGRCLEVGAATGILSQILKQNGHQVTATDISPKMVAQIKKKKITSIVCDAEKLPFKAKSFDTIIASEVLYYLDNQQKFLKQASRILKPGGFLLMSNANHNIGHFYDQARTILRKIGISQMYFDDPNRSFIKSSNLIKALKQEGFDIIENKKIVIFPLRQLNFLNCLLEKTFLSHLGLFILTKAQKPGNPSLC